MIIAIDKNSYQIPKKDGNEYIYLFNDERLDTLLNTNLHCVYYKNCNFVDINLTDYEIDCFKTAKITDKNYDELPDKKDYKIGIIIPNYNYEHTIDMFKKYIKSNL